MYLSLKILSELVDLEGLSIDEIANKLTMSTAEIDGVEKINHHFETIVTAKLLEVKKHPDSDHLTVVKADTGSAVYDLICGAPNHKTGDIAALALEGTKFSDEFIIKKTKIRGVESSGMLCSLRELGLSEDHSGIIIFPADTKLGIPLSEIYKDYVDTRIEIDNKSITHRPDLWGHIGFARELSAIFGRKLKKNYFTDLNYNFAGDNKLSVEIKCPESAYRYTGLVVKNIKIGESPDWLKARISSIGMRPINNIVDITNYVMSEIGEPMHAFDRKKLSGDKIIVRMAEDGEKLSTLDGSEHNLTKDDIVIADSGKPIALAGVMGGANSEIDDSTSEIVLEAACFNAVNIRKTAHRFVLRTDAAMRFEKSLDPEITVLAIKRSYDLIKQLIPEAECISPLVDVYPSPFKKIEVNTSASHIRNMLGAEISDERIVSILTSLDYKVENKNGSLKVDVPSYRATKDVEIEADIVEEIGRIFGYDNITPNPPLVACETPAINEKRKFERAVKSILTGTHNMIEVYNYSFVGEEILNKTLSNEDKELRLRNPLSVEHDRLRRSLVPFIVSNAEYNLRFNKKFAIYEMGRTYIKKNRTDAELAEENYRIAGAYCDDENAETFYSAKNAVVDMFDQLRLKSARIVPAVKNIPPFAHPARTAEVLINGNSAGFIFGLHPQVKNNFGIKASVSLFDISLDAMFEGTKKKILFSELQKFPDVPFELSVICAKNVYASDIADSIRNVDKKLIRNISVITVYEGSPIPEGSKSVSFEIVLGSDDKTLTPQEIEKLQTGIMDAVKKKGYSIR